MAPAARRAAPAPAPAAEAVNFGDLGFYTSGASFTLPEGDYALEFDVRLHAFTKKDGSRGQENLGVMVTAYPINPDGTAKAGDDGNPAEPLEQFYSMGGKAKLSFAPNPETGKGLVAIPGAPSTTLTGMTNWNEFLKHLYNAGLPPGVFVNDLSVLDGIWVHTQNVPEPEERKSFGNKAQTGEQAQAQEERRDQMISVVTEILEGGAPWDGGGGIPDANAAPAPKAGPVARKSGPKPAPTPAKAAPAKKAAPAPVVEQDTDVRDMAIAVISSVIEANPNGLMKIKLNTEAFKVAQKEYPDYTQSIVDDFLRNEEELSGILGEMGYEVKGPQIKPAS